jgi:hypothetical protein
VDQQCSLVNYRGTGSFCWYFVLANNCADFTVAGLYQGHALSSAKVSQLGYPQPNRLFSQLQQFENDEFDFMNVNKQKACVSTAGPNGLDTTCTTE